MPEAEMDNLYAFLEQRWSPQILEILRRMAEIVSQRGLSLYLVGGGVRDLFLGRENLDLDMVVEGDALPVAQALASELGAKAKTHPRFGTAQVRFRGWSLDLITARSETYRRPGALPQVQPGTLEDDLRRRDFTINAMALRLWPEPVGKLVDPLGGKADLEAKLIRVLHPNSFIDDATRILRALRYETRLGFHLEAVTQEWLKMDVAMLQSISGDRLRHELELILKEPEPEKVLMRAEVLGALSQLHPALRGNGQLAQHYEEARRHFPTPPWELYLCLLVEPLSLDQLEELVQRLHFRRTTTHLVKHTLLLRQKADALTQPSLSPSHIYSHLQGFTPIAIRANAIASPQPLIQDRLLLYLNRLRYVKLSLTGENLLRLGVPQGPATGQLLNELRRARLDSLIKNRKEEEDFVRSWLASRPLEELTE